MEYTCMRRGILQFEWICWGLPTGYVYIVMKMKTIAYTFEYRIIAPERLLILEKNSTQYMFIPATEGKHDWFYYTDCATQKVWSHLYHSRPQVADYIFMINLVRYVNGSPINVYRKYSFESNRFGPSRKLLFNERVWQFWKLCEKRSTHPVY